MVGRSTSNSSLFLVLSALLGVSLGIPNAGCGDSGESRTPVAVRVTEYVNLADLEGPMPDAEVCETDTENCVITDEEGRASIELPSDTEVSYTITKEGYGSYLVSDVNTGRLDHRFIMYSDEELARLAPLMGTTYPWTDTGIMILRVYSEPGVMFDLVGQSNQPFYFIDGDTPSTELDATTADGRGGFTDLAEGQYQVEFIDNQVCKAFTAWPGDMANSVKVPVKAGYISWSSMACGQSPTP
ncbi:MAG TPA: hypothetical protein VFG22_12455 [Polyangiales bacterium]|nr:hypothetical protein [Polyangiales bacterium]